MFTGIVTHLGTVVALEHDAAADTALLTLDAGGALDGLPAGGSLAVHHARDPARSAPWWPAARPPPQTEKAPRPETAEPAQEETPGPPDDPDP